MKKENEVRRSTPNFQFPRRGGRAARSHELLSSSHCFWLKIERSAYKGLRARIDVCCNSLSLPANILTKILRKEESANGCPHR
jgi:hypothetical protein